MSLFYKIDFNEIVNTFYLYVAKKIPFVSSQDMEIPETFLNHGYKILICHWIIGSK